MGASVKTLVAAVMIFHGLLDQFCLMRLVDAVPQIPLEVYDDESSDFVSGEQLLALDAADEQALEQELEEEALADALEEVLTPELQELTPDEELALEEGIKEGILEDSAGLGPQGTSFINPSQRFHTLKAQQLAKLGNSIGHNAYRRRRLYPRLNGIHHQLTPRERQLAIFMRNARQKRPNLPRYPVYPNARFNTFSGASAASQNGRVVGQRPVAVPRPAIEPLTPEVTNSNLDPLQIELMKFGQALGQQLRQNPELFKTYFSTPGSVETQVGSPLEIISPTSVISPSAISSSSGLTGASSGITPNGIGSPYGAAGTIGATNPVGAPFGLTAATGQYGANGINGPAGIASSSSSSTSTIATGPTNIANAGGVTGPAAVAN